MSALVELPARAPAKPPRYATPPDLQLVGPLPSAVERVASDIDDLSAELSAAVGAATRTRALDCFARQVAAAQLMVDGELSPSFVRFAAARCGVVGAPTWVSSTSTGPADEAQLAANARAAVGELAGATSAARGDEVGAATSVAGDRVVAVVAVSHPTATLAPVPMVAVGDEVVLRGELDGDAESVFAYATRGQVEVAECARDWSVELPAFVLRCPAADDPWVWLELHRRDAGRLLADSVGQFMVSRGELPTSFHTVAAGDAADTDPMAVVGGINRVRKELGLHALQVIPDQQVQTARLTAHYLQATFDGDDAAADELALGMLSGWKVPKLIRGGGFASAVLTRGGRDGIRENLDRPYVRHVLLDREAVFLAVGTVPLAGASFTTLTTWRTFADGMDYGPVEAALLDRYDAMRSGRGLGPLARVGKDGETGQVVRDAAEQVKSGQKTPEEAMKWALRTLAERFQVSVKGWAVSTTDLPSLALPTLLAKLAQPVVVIHIDRYRPPGSPWGEYVVFLIVAEE